MGGATELEAAAADLVIATSSDAAQDMELEHGYAPSGARDGQLLPGVTSAEDKENGGELPVSGAAGAANPKVICRPKIPTPSHCLQPFT